MFFDWISPTMQIFNALRGHKTILGSVEEMKALEKRGVKCHAPFYVGDVDGEYLWQVKNRDYKLACKILGGER